MEHSLHVAQSFDISGRRELRRDAAIRRSEAAAANNSARRVDLAAEIRRRFYEVLLKQEIVKAGQTWVERFARVESVVQKLARAGEASGYDRRRLEREREAARARLAVESADFKTGSRVPCRFDRHVGKRQCRRRGRFTRPAVAPLDGALPTLDQRPDLQVLAKRAESADPEGRAAARNRIPDVTLGVGPKWVDNGMTRENGFVLALSVPLPVFDRGQSEQARAAAEALNAYAEYRLAGDRAESELRGLHRQLTRLAATAHDYRQQVVAATPELLRIAEVAHRGGESSILELLDAYRGALDSELTELDLEWRARTAQIQFELQTGRVAQ